MNADFNQDELEQRLRRQPVKQIPGAWRNEILSAARESAKQASTPAAPHVSRFTFHAILLHVFGTHRKAWATLAAAWLAIAALNYSAREAQPTLSAHSNPSLPQMREVLRQQQLVRAELLERAGLRAQPNPPPAMRPQSGRRDEFHTA